MIDKAKKAEKAEHLSLKDIFLIIEEDKLIPEVKADIPGVGPLENLYSYVYECVCFCVRSQTKEVHEDSYDIHSNHLNIIFKYLIDNGLLKTPKRPVSALTIKLQISAELLGEHDRFINAERSGLLENHPDREYIKSLWKAVVMYRRSPLLSLYLDSLKAVVI